MLTANPNQRFHKLRFLWFLEFRATGFQNTDWSGNGDAVGAQFREKEIFLEKPENLTIV
jgi:hypothetical protein